MDPLLALKSSGIGLPSPAYLAGVLVFGLVGMLAWWRGRKPARPRVKWLGLALMFYPYAVWNTWLLYAVGTALCAGLYFGRE